METVCCPPYVEGDVEYDRETGKVLAWVPRKGGPIKLWCHLDGYGKPLPWTYAAGADCSAGVGTTNSCLTIVDAERKEKVLELATPFMRPDEFAAKCVALCRWFANASGTGALFAWESQGPGVPFGQRVTELGYRNVYLRTNEMSYQRKQHDTPGWVPTTPNKRTLLEEYRSALTNREFTNRSREAVEECLDFVHLPNGSIEHSASIGNDDPTGARVNHGDRVIADALAWKMTKQLGIETPKQKAKDEPALLSLEWRRQYQKRQADREEREAALYD
jgi:hypothetical protein